MTEKTVYVCNHIFENTKPVLLVSHSDGDWQFLCGGEHKKSELPMVVGINHILDRDPTIKKVMNIPIDHDAERSSIDSRWLITKENSNN